MANDTREPKRAKARINPFDVIIIILILCLLGTLGFRIYDGVSTENVNRESKYFITFTCDDVYSSLADYLTEDAAVYFEDGTLLGYIYYGKDDAYAVELITLGSSSDETEAEEGAGAETEGSEATESTPAYQKVSLSCAIRLNHETDVVDGGACYSIGYRNISVGSTVKVYTDKAVFTLLVRSIETIK